MINRDLQFDTELLLALRKADVSCRNCRFWKQHSSFENVQNSGKCTGLRGGEIEVFVDCHGDGGVEYIETDEDFFCANFRYGS